MSNPEKRAPILVLGIGNILLRDEGVGVRLIEAMRGMALPPGVELVDGGTAGADLLDIISNRRKVFVIDAVDAGLEPGAILRLHVEDLASAGRPLVSLHEIALTEALAAAQIIGSMPDEVIIWGVQPKSVSPDDTLSEEVASAMPQLIERIIAELAR
ncbi:MAG TPA: HyaD/HybD family hydrogenase maturation endopeptidase [Phycisphaerae bacterium]|nr:HyaD/HybD family hydrogenase maturation endopeptidase [Phycisphaerae bacterium]HRR84834.1 HyaD/HybD family hydrogenase maturation endopeptidase [Phycisphaerae bacterium]